MVDKALLFIFGLLVTVGIAALFIQGCRGALTDGGMTALFW